MYMYMHTRTHTDEAVGKPSLKFKPFTAYEHTHTHTRDETHVCR